MQTRLDQWITDHAKISKSLAQKWIEQGMVKFNGKTTKKPAQRVSTSDLVEYKIPKLAVSKLKPEDLSLEIIFEDEKILVINKAPGMVVHPDESGHQTGTVAHAVLGHGLQSEGWNEEQRPGIVHRLDKDTSGVLVVAKTPLMHQHLSKLFHDREVEKIYLALVKGVPLTNQGKIDAPLKRSNKNRQKIAVHHGGRHAITHFKVLQTWQDMSLLEVRIETGRTHQIRVHLASIGHPVVGDGTYGDTAFNKIIRKKTGLSRQFLHAQKISFEKRSFEAPLSNDLAETIKLLS